MAHQINLKLQFNFGRIRALFSSRDHGKSHRREKRSSQPGRRLEQNRRGQYNKNEHRRSGESFPSSPQQPATQCDPPARGQQPARGDLDEQPPEAGTDGAGTTVENWTQQKYQISQDG